MSAESIKDAYVENPMVKLRVLGQKAGEVAVQPPPPEEGEQQ